MRLRCLLFVLPAFFLPVTGAHAQGSIAHAAALPQSCDVRSGQGCHIAGTIGFKGHAITEMYDRKLYADLENTTKRLCAGKRLPDGQPELFSFVSGFDSQFRYSRDYGRIEQQLAAWRKAHPQSIAGALAEAMYWHVRAWQARGSGYARTVPGEAWELFYERLQKSAAILERSQSYAAACPLWHSMKIDVLLEQGAQPTAIETAYVDAVKRFPDAQQIHAAMARAYTSKWGGNAEKFDQFARRAAQLSAGSEGFGMYARLYWTQDCDCDDALSFDGASEVPAWSDLKLGFNDLLKRYPQDLWNANKFAALACRAGDGATYGAMRRKIGKHIYDEQWHSSFSPEVCDRRFYKDA